MDDPFLSWAEKYRPKLIKNVVGNSKAIKSILSWLNEYEQNKKIQMVNPKKKKKNKITINDDLDSSDTEETRDIDINAPIITSTAKSYNSSYENDHSCMVILGDHGVGKTCTALAVLSEKKYRAKMINLGKISSIKNIDEYVEKVMKDIHIFNHLIGMNDMKSVIVVDEIQSVSSQIEKHFIEKVLELNEKFWYCPVIFISSNIHNKVISTLKEISKIVYFQQPTSDHLQLLLLTICKKENMTLENVSVANKIIDHSQKDYRRLLFVLNDLRLNYGLNITNIMIDEYCVLSKKKDTDIDIYKATASMIINYQNIDECMRLYEGEKVIIPLMIHQNYIKCINDFYNKKEKSYELANDIALSIAKGDLIENYIYNDQNWDMQEVHGFFACVKPSFRLSSEKMNVTEGVIRSVIKFPDDFNKVSITRINKKNIVNSTNCLKNFEINDFIYANKLIKLLIEQDHISECADLFSGYGATVEVIESVLKIDKINETKTALQSVIKKKFNQILGTNKKKKTIKKT